MTCRRCYYTRTHKRVDDPTRSIHLKLDVKWSAKTKSTNEVPHGALRLAGVHLESRTSLFLAISLRCVTHVTQQHSGRTW